MEIGRRYPNECIERQGCDLVLGTTGVPMTPTLRAMLAKATPGSWYCETEQDFAADGTQYTVETGSGKFPGRECQMEWVRDMVRQCRAAKVNCFVKQLHIDGRLVTDPALFPADLRVRELAWRQQ